MANVVDQMDDSQYKTYLELLGEVQEFYRQEFHNADPND